MSEPVPSMDALIEATAEIILDRWPRKHGMTEGDARIYARRVLSAVLPLVTKPATEALDAIADYPPKGHPRRAKDGYPAEVAYDEFAYKRAIDSYREAIRSVRDHLRALGGG